MKPRYAFAFILCALLTACSSLGIAPAKSLSDRIGYAYGTNAGLRTAAANSLAAGTLKVEDAEYVLKVTDSSRVLLDTAKAALLGGDPKTAEGRLLLTISILEQLQSYLNSKVRP